MQIIPSILVQSEEEFKNQINAIRNSLDMVQLDIADGAFVPNTTWADPVATQTHAKDMDLELHLMVEHPLQELARWVGVPQVQRVLFHYESKDDLFPVIEMIHDNGWEASMVLNPDTNITVIDQYAHLLEGAMLMGVVPGFQGQAYIPETTERLKALRATYPDLFIELDGAVNMETLEQIVPTDIHAVCPGSAISKGTSTAADRILAMQQLINTLTDQAQNDSLDA